jgi:hypothetical protein
MKKRSKYLYKVMRISEEQVDKDKEGQPEETEN